MINKYKNVFNKHKNMFNTRILREYRTGVDRPYIFLELPVHGERLWGKLEPIRKLEKPGPKLLSLKPEPV